MSNSRLDGVRKGTRIPDLLLRSTVFPFTVFAKGPILSHSVLFFATFLKDSSHVVLPIYHLCQALLVPL